MPKSSIRLILPLATLLCAGSAHATVAADTADIPTLIAAYHQAVVGHDGARLAQLFVPEGSAWFSVLAERPWRQARAAKPGAPKVRPGNVGGFVQMVATSKAALDPQHSNLRITSDGEVATVTFDFHFVIDGKVENRGAESWQLIRGADGWRIASIVYSATPTP